MKRKVKNGKEIITKSSISHAFFLFLHIDAFTCSENQKMSAVGSRKRGGGSVIVLAAISWDSLEPTITPHGFVMAEVYEAIFTGLL